MSISRTIAIVGLLALATAGAGVASGTRGATSVYPTNPRTVQPDGKKGGVWQSISNYSVPNGTTSLFYHYPCPAQDPIVVSGGFASNNTGQSTSYALGYNGPRTDESPPNFGEWGWHFYWPDGAPSGTVLTFTVYCTK